jgi:hypothetical protein
VGVTVLVAVGAGDDVCARIVVAGVAGVSVGAATVVVGGAVGGATTATVVAVGAMTGVRLVIAGVEAAGCCMTTAEGVVATDRVAAGTVDACADAGATVADFVARVATAVFC